MLPIGSHIQRLISSCDEGVYVCTRLRNTAKAGLDMRNKGNFSQKIFLRDMEISFNICEGHENNTLCRPLSGIFLFAHRSLWNPITPSTQAEICSNSDRPIGNIYY